LRIVCSVPRGLRLPAAIVVAVAVAELAVFVLRPRDTGPDPVPVRPRAYFSQEFLERADEFRGGQRLIFFANSAVALGVLGMFAVRRPLSARRPVVVGAALSLAVGAATLPLSAVARERAKDVGLVTQSWTGWAEDVAKSQAIAAVIAAAGAGLLVLGMRRFGSRWWIAGAVVIVGYGAFMTFASPVVLDPLFNKFERLPAGALRSDVLDLARRADVDVGEVYRIDASRRTTAANAYVTGLGHTKRVVLYDNLIEDFSPEEVRHVVAHELGHVASDDVLGNVLYLALVAPFGMFAVAVLTRRLVGPGDRRPGSEVVPAVALSLAVVAALLSVPGNQLSRSVERRADAFALRLTADPDAQITFQSRIAIKNVGDPDPPAWVQFLLGTHPTTLQRIGQAEAYRRDG
jgi:STE24 endopeptidase